MQRLTKTLHRLSCFRGAHSLLTVPRSAGVAPDVKLRVCISSLQVPVPGVDIDKPSNYYFKRHGMGRNSRPQIRARV